MVIAVGRVRLRINGSRSLKGKRKVIKGIIAKVCSRFNCSIAEVGLNDAVNEAEIGLSITGNNGQFVDSAMNKALSFIENNIDAEVIKTSFELIHLGGEYDAV